MHKFKFKGFAENKEALEKIIRYNLNAIKIDKGKTYVFIDGDNKSIDCDLDSLDFYWNYPIAIYVVKKKKSKEIGVPLINVWGTSESVKNFLVKENKEEELVEAIVAIRYSVPDPGHMGFPGEGYDWINRTIKMMIPKRIQESFNCFKKLTLENIGEIKEIISKYTDYNFIDLNIIKLEEWTEELSNKTDSLDKYMSKKTQN